jgi:hypothetical protein
MCQALNTLKLLQKIHGDLHGRRITPSDPKHDG